MNIQIIQIDEIKPAPYNPRKISDSQFAMLKESLTHLGFLIPVIVNQRNHIIIAGHQRTKAAKALGITQIPAVFVDGVNDGDEIKFNQLHNGCDYEIEVTGSVQQGFDTGFHSVNASLFSVSGTYAPIVKEICKLLIKYGNVLCAVVCGNTVVSGMSYIKACQTLGMDVNISVADSDQLAMLETYMKQDYGVYSYDGIKRNTYVQGLAQLFRLPADQKKRQMKSHLYEDMVFPFLNQNAVRTILDFGCGKGAYIKTLKPKYKAVGVEFFNNNGKQINLSMGHRMIDDLLSFLAQEDGFDCVVCDSVLNSVDSMEAEEAILSVLNVFTKRDLFISGRTIESYESKLKHKKCQNIGKRLVDFLDENGMSAMFREGNWYFQKWHRKEQILSELQQFGFTVKKIVWGNGSFQIHAVKAFDLPDAVKRKGLQFEFNLPLPGGKRYERHKEVIQACEIAGLL